MTRLILVALFSVLSLLVLFRAPANLLWYLAILLTEFCWVFVLILLVLLCWRFGSPRFYLFTNLFALVAMAIYCLPIVQALRLSKKLPAEFAAAFGSSVSDDVAPFRPLQMLTGIGARQVSFQTLTYDSANNLTLDFYRSAVPGQRPLVVVVHGGSWAGGNSRQLPELNSELAKEGYHVAAINYRLAPAHHFPAPVEDVKTAIDYLCRRASEFSFDTARITLLGRSAGGQVVLSAACLLNDSRINGAVVFYGPADMIWGYDNPCNPLVLDSRKVMRDYLGGSLADVPAQYANSSATETVMKHTPPLLLLYAENDPLVSPRHADRLLPKLKAAGVRHFLLNLPWATHAFDYTLNGPGGQLSTWLVKRFLQSVNQPLKPD